MNGAIDLRRLTRFAAALVAGGACGFGMGRLARALGAPRHTVVWADDLALLLGTALLGGAVYVALLAADRLRLARALECDAELPASADEVGLFRLQAAVLALAGAMLVTPVLFAPLARADREAGLIALAATAAAFALQILLNRAVWTRADEVLRAGILQAAAVAFWVGQGLLFLWAAAERLSIAPPITAWETLVVLLALYLAASAVTSVRLQARA